MYIYVFLKKWFIFRIKRIRDTLGPRFSADKKKVCRLRVRDRVLTQVEEFKYARVLFMSDDKSGAGHRPTDWCEDKALTSPMVTSLWVVTEIMRSQIQAAKINFLQRVAGLSRDRVRSH